MADDLRPRRSVLYMPAANARALSDYTSVIDFLRRSVVAFGVGHARVVALREDRAVGLDERAPE